MSRTVLYLVVPCFNEEQILEQTATALRDKMYELINENVIDENSKIVFVDDGSIDRTKEIMDVLHKENTIYSIISFSRNYGHQNAVMAGYKFSKDKCDAVISIDADLQQDINAIDEFLRMFDQGYDIVYGVRNDRNTDGFLKRTTSQLFYSIMESFGCDTIRNHADYRLLSNKVLKVLDEFNETNLFLRGLIPTLGFKSCIVYFDVKDRMLGESKYSMKKMINLAVDGITSYSIRPMHIIFAIGWVVFLGAIINMIYTIIAYFRGQVVSGWSTIVVSIWGLGGIQLISIGCIGLYIGKNYLESKRRPRYIIESIVHEETHNDM